MNKKIDLNYFCYLNQLCFPECTQAKVDEARQALNEIIIHNTELLRRKRSFIDQRRGLEQKINVRQRKLVIYLHSIIVYLKFSIKL